MVLELLGVRVGGEPQRAPYGPAFDGAHRLSVPVDTPSDRARGAARHPQHPATTQPWSGSPPSHCSFLLLGPPQRPTPGVSASPDDTVPRPTGSRACGSLLSSPGRGSQKPRRPSPRSPFPAHPACACPASAHLTSAHLTSAHLCMPGLCMPDLCTPGLCTSLHARPLHAWPLHTQPLHAWPQPQQAFVCSHSDDLNVKRNLV